MSIDNHIVIVRKTECMIKLIGKCRYKLIGSISIQAVHSGKILTDAEKGWSKDEYEHCPRDRK